MRYREIGLMQCFILVAGWPSKDDRERKNGDIRVTIPRSRQRMQGNGNGIGNGKGIADKCRYNQSTRYYLGISQGRQGWGSEKKRICKTYP
jgi:hypothetical protein